MKIFLLATLLTLSLSNASGQWYWGISFEDPFYIDRIVRDTVANPNCHWQIGSPQKAVFTSAHSVPNVIVTDTLNPVPANDISVFYLKHARDNNMPAHFFALHFWFQMDGDSSDFGNVDVSPDNGQTWINLLHDDVFYNFNWMSPKPTLRGSTTGWQTFDLDMGSWASAPAGFSDTVLFRFIYVTDSSSTPHDGWMIDDFFLEDWIESVPEIRNDNLISVFPNPASDYLYIQTIKSTNIYSVKIMNQLGQVIYSNENFTGTTIDTRNIPAGIYYLKYSDDKFFSVKKFMIER